MTLDAKGHCPACNKKPAIAGLYLFCAYCCRAFDPRARQQIANWWWRVAAAGGFERNPKAMDFSILRAPPKKVAPKFREAS